MSKYGVVGENWDILFDYISFILVFDDNVCGLGIFWVFFFDFFMMDLIMILVFLLLLFIWIVLVSVGVDDMWDGLNSKFNLFIFLIKIKKKIY